MSNLMSDVDAVHVRRKKRNLDMLGVALDRAIGDANKLGEMIMTSARRLRPHLVLGAVLSVAISPVLAGDGAAPGRQKILHSSYGVHDESSKVGSSEVTQFLRADGSRSYLVREHMENYGPILDRFLIISYDENGDFDSGHWVATADYVPHFGYSYHFDGKAIRGRWEDSNRGQGWADVPAKRGTPVVTFWGFPESLILSEFNPDGSDRQWFDAAGIEDNIHTPLRVLVERKAPEKLQFATGEHLATPYRVTRFGDTHHWLNQDGTLLRWVSEGGHARWELERGPEPSPPERSVSPVAKGVYLISSPDGVSIGKLDWRIGKSDAGGLLLEADEETARRSSAFRGTIDGNGRWKGSSETVNWVTDNTGKPGAETQHFETFFYRERLHLARFRDASLPYLQSIKADRSVSFHHGDNPATAAFWLGKVVKEVGKEQRIDAAVFENNYWGAGAEVHKVRVTYLGKTNVPGSGGRAKAHQYMLSYPGGWHDHEVRIWAGEEHVPIYVKKGDAEYRLVDFDLLDPSMLGSGNEKHTGMDNR